MLIAPHLAGSGCRWGDETGVGEGSWKEGGNGREWVGEQRPTSTWGLGEGRDGEGILKILCCLLKIYTVQAESSLHFP